MTLTRRGNDDDDDDDDDDDYDDEYELHSSLCFLFLKQRRNSQTCIYKESGVLSVSSKPWYTLTQYLTFW